jgi:hypothetical protein
MTAEASLAVLPKSTRRQVASSAFRLDAEQWRRISEQRLRAAAGALGALI